MDDPSQARSASDVARQFMDCYSKGDIEGMAALCSEDGLLDYVAMGTRGQGKLHELGVALWRTFVNAFEGFTPEIREIWEDTTRNTAIVATINRGIQREDVAGVASRGGELAAPHVFIFALGLDSRIVKIAAYWDYLTMYRQLGFPTELVKELTGSNS